MSRCCGLAGCVATLWLASSPVAAQDRSPPAATSPLKQSAQASPVRRWEIYLLPHSHVDIGYTALQTEIEKHHWRYLEEAIEAARRTADYPAGSRFKWNTEVLWAVDGYLKQASPAKQAEFLEAVKRGWIGLDGLYCHELGALCRPAELARLTDFAIRLRQQYGVSIDAAMATDIAGYTWGIVPVLAESGLKYFSWGPNANHRVGFVRDWDNRPFYWVSACGRHKVLCWQTGSGYSPGFQQESQLLDYLQRFEREKPDYPYEMLYFRYCRGDNAGPDLKVSDWVRRWNARHEYPKLIIATTSELFQQFEKRYAARIPTARGDFTPYWEDGAASTARETAVNRAAAERLAQAETLWALLKPKAYPDRAFYEAWRNVLLYDEHTWGGQSYVRNGKYPPGSEGYEAQWKIKRAFWSIGRTGPGSTTSSTSAGRILPARLAAGRFGSAAKNKVPSWHRSWRRPSLPMAASSSAGCE